MKKTLRRVSLAALPGLPVALVLAAGWAIMAYQSPPEAMAGANLPLGGGGRTSAQTVPINWTDSFTGSLTPGTTPTAGPANPAADDAPDDDAAYFEIYAPSGNSGVMLVGFEGDATPALELPAGGSMLLMIDSLERAQFDGFDADDKITYLGYR